MKRLKRNYYKSMIENVCVCVCVCVWERESERERERERDELTKTELLQKHDGEWVILKNMKANGI